MQNIGLVPVVHVEPVLHRRRRSGFIIGLAAFALAALMATPVQAQTWGPIVQVSSSDNVGEGPWNIVTASGGVVHAGYGTDTPSGFFYRRSVDGGATWDPQQQLVPDATADVTWSDGMVSSGQLVVALFSRVENGTTQRLYYRRSVDAGVTWLAEQTVATYPSVNQSMGLASVAVSGSLVVVTWTDRHSSTSGFVRERRSTDSGATLKPVIKIGSYSGWDALPKAAASGKHVYVTWVANSGNGEVLWTGLKLRRSTDSGASFKPIQTMEHGSLPISKISTAASGNIFLATYDVLTKVVRLTRSANGGATLTSSSLATGHTSTSYRTAGGVAIDGLQARAVWEDYGGAYIRTSADGGKTWAAQQTVYDPTTVFTSSPDVAIDGSHTVVIAWLSTDNGGELVSRGT